MVGSRPKPRYSFFLSCDGLTARVENKEIWVSQSVLQHRRLANPVLTRNTLFRKAVMRTASHFFTFNGGHTGLKDHSLFFVEKNAIADAGAVQRALQLQQHRCVQR
jgi:hypothetical protein